MTQHHAGTPRLEFVRRAAAIAALTAVVSACSSGHHANHAAASSSAPGGSLAASASASGLPGGNGSGAASAGGSASSIPASAAASGAATGPTTPAPTLPPADVSVTTAAQNLPLRVHKGQVLSVGIPASVKPSAGQVKFALIPAGNSVLTPTDNMPGYYKAVGDGVVTVSLTQAPVCQPNEACPAHVIEVASVKVTVWG